MTLILDLGAMHMNGEFDTVASRARSFVPRLTHVHVSEPHLAPSAGRRDRPRAAAAALRAAGYGRAVSIEMKRPEGGLEILHGRVAALVRATAAGVPD